MTYSRKKGFTTIEILFVIIILSTIVVSAVKGFAALSVNFKVASNYLGFYLKGREMVDIVSKDCRMAIRVMDEYGPFTTTDSSLVLKLPSIDGNEDVIDIDNEFDHVIYRMDAGDLRKTVVPGSNSSRQAYDGVLERSIESFYLTEDGVPFSSISKKSTIKRITISATIKETVLDRTYTISTGTTVKLMNYEWEHVR